MSEVSGKVVCNNTVKAFCVVWVMFFSDEGEIANIIFSCSGSGTVRRGQKVDISTVSSGVSCNPERRVEILPSYKQGW